MYTVPTMFCDEVTVELRAGKGGDGAIAFRREKFIDKGGPNGGNGGKGGSLFVRANENINTLAEFNTYKIFRAKNGESGQGWSCAGADAEDLYLDVPVGTTIYDEKKKKIIADLSLHGQIYCAARGGRGGYGNEHFKSSTRQAPAFAELGEPGELRTVTLELKLVADVGIIGLPSVGKSTLISRISNARPKIAAYHFTTLIPNLGVVTMEPFGGSSSQSFVACDLPGLIEGAHEGKGLGIQFLKHVARNRVLVHLLDATSSNILHDLKIIRDELKSFDPELIKKPCIYVINKIDTVSESTLDALDKKVKKDLKKIRYKVTSNVYHISGVTGKGLKDLMFAIWGALKNEREKELAQNSEKKKSTEESDYKVYTLRPEDDPRSFSVRIVRKGVQKKHFQITGKRLEQIVIMTDFNNPEAVARVYDVCEKMGITKELKRNGAHFGDDIHIGDQKITFKWLD